MHTLKVDRNSAGIRLDRFLRQKFPGEGLSTFFAILRKKKVRVNGAVAKAPQILNEGDEVAVYENLKEAAPAKANGWGSSARFSEQKFFEEHFDIALETEDFLVMNKPSGVASQQGTGTRKGETLTEMLWEWGRQNALDFKPTLAHRLDQETSGLVVAALHGDVLRDLTRLIREHKMQKFYLALVKGNLEKERGTIRLQLERTDSARGSKMQVGSGKEAVTHYALQRRFKDFDLVKIRLETGKMHQIRAHFASIGHPLAGDTRYGDFAGNRALKKAAGLARLFLHSTRLEFDYKGKRHVIEAKLPPELESVLKKL